MKFIIGFLLFTTVGFSQESKYLLESKRILDLASGTMIDLEKSIGELDHALVGINPGSILNKILKVDNHYARIISLQSKAMFLIDKITKDKNLSSEIYFDEMQQASELQCFSKRSLKFAEKKMKNACKRIEYLEKKNKRKPEPRPSGRAFLLSIF